MRRVILEDDLGEPECPMTRSVEYDKNRHSPRNREMAFAFQFHDTARTLFQMSHTVESCGTKDFEYFGTTNSFL